MSLDSAYETWARSRGIDLSKPFKVLSDSVESGAKYLYLEVNGGSELHYKNCFVVDFMDKKLEDYL